MRKTLAGTGRNAFPGRKCRNMYSDMQGVRHDRNSKHTSLQSEGIPPRQQPREQQ